MQWRIFVVLGSLLAAITNGQSDCTGQWQSFATCLRKQQQDVLTQAGLSPPSGFEQDQLESSIRNCFSKSGCRDPIVSDDENSARLDCYHRSQQKLRSELQDCVRSDIRGFTLPEDNFGTGDMWSIFLKQLNDAVHNYQDYCSRGRSSTTVQRDLRVCVEQSLSDFARRRSSNGNGQRQQSPQQSANPRFAFRQSQNTQRGRGYCAMRAQCIGSGQQSMSESCDGEWNGRAVPRLCSCGQQIRSRGSVTSYQASYASCMSSKRYQVNRSRDPAIGWLESGLSSWCPRGSRGGSTNPCSGGSNGGQGGQGGGGGSSSSQGGQGGSQGGGSSGNQGNQGSQGGQGGSWTGGQGGSQGVEPSINQGTQGSIVGQRPSSTTWAPAAGQSTTRNWFFGQSSTQGPDDGGDGNWDGGNQQVPDQSAFTNGPPTSNTQTGNGGGGLFGGLFGGGLNGAGSTDQSSGSSGGTGDLFGGALNTLGIGNPLDNGSLLSQVAGFGQTFQGLLGGGRRRK